MSGKIVNKNGVLLNQDNDAHQRYLKQRALKQQEKNSLTSLLDQIERLNRQILVLENRLEKMEERLNG